MKYDSVNGSLGVEKMCWMCWTGPCRTMKPVINRMDPRENETANLRGLICGWAYFLKVVEKERDRIVSTSRINTCQKSEEKKEDKKKRLKTIRMDNVKKDIKKQIMDPAMQIRKPIVRSHLERA